MVSNQKFKHQEYLVDCIRQELSLTQDAAAMLEQQILDLTAERDQWQACALLAGEYCGDSVGPVGYYEFTPRQFKEWFATTAAYKKPALQEKRDE